MVLEASLTIDTTGPFIRGEKVHVSGQTIKQDAERVSDLLFLTLMAQNLSTLKWVPFTENNPALSPASLQCGANGGNLAAYQAVGDGSFKISVDGSLLDITGIVLTGVAALTDIAAIINIALAGRAFCFYDEVGDSFTFISPKQGLPGSSIGVLTAGSAGTDISGAGFLNGLSGTGVVTAAAGGDGEDIPAGLYLGQDIATADIVAGDVAGKSILRGKSVELDEDKIVLENGMTFDTVITKTGKTVKSHLADLGIYPVPTQYFQNIQPIA